MAKERRLETAKKYLSRAEKIGRWKFWVGLVVSGGVLSWAAKASDWLSQYTPFSWVFSFFVGMLIVAVISALLSIAYSYLTEAKYNTILAKEPSSINSLEDLFQKKVIKIVDFKRPTENQFLKAKKFIGCDLFGPAVIYIKSSTLTNSSLVRCDFIKIPDKSRFINVIAFDSMFIDDCTLVDITFLVPEGHAENMEKSMPGFVWANQPPEK